jgi:hypothetical protein
MRPVHRFVAPGEDALTAGLASAKPADETRPTLRAPAARLVA